MPMPKRIESSQALLRRCSGEAGCAADVYQIVYLWARFGRAETNGASAGWLCRKAVPNRSTGRTAIFQPCAQQNYCANTHHTNGFAVNGRRSVCMALAWHVSPRERIGYRAAHRRVRAQRGPASDYRCVSCGRPAVHWSYSHDDPDEQLEDGSPYSADPAHYRPRCAKCHRVFDAAHAQGRVLRRHRTAFHRLSSWSTGRHHCPGCAHMCRVHPCFPGCGSPWAAGRQSLPRQAPSNPRAQMSH